MNAFFASLMLVVLAEMGDKTQLLAMTLGARYGMRTVLIGTFLATVVINSLSVAAGRFLAVIIPFEIISLVAAFSFIGFGLWGLKPETLGDEGKKENKRLGPVAAIALAFFLMELGDKTQLAAVSLAIQYDNALGVLAGATLGMVTADAVGIATGAFLMRYIPEKTVKWISASVFIIFGFISIYRSLAARLGFPALMLVLSLAGLATFFLAFFIGRIFRQAQETDPKEVTP